MDLSNVTFQDLQQYKIFVGTPCYGGMATGIYTQSLTHLMHLCTLRGINMSLHMLFNESLVQRARNYVVDEFLRSDCTHLLFIDSDIGFNPEDVFAMLAINHTDPEKYNIVTGPYPKKTIAWEKVVEAVKKDMVTEPTDCEQFAADYVFNLKDGVGEFRVDEPVEVSEAGTGFMMIPRSVFEKYDEAYPEYRYLPDHVRTKNFDGSKEITAYFDCSIDPESKRYLSEDYHFCRKAQDIGIRVWMCPWMHMIHLGSYPFRGSMAALAAINASPTA